MKPRPCKVVRIQIRRSGFTILVFALGFQAWSYSGETWAETLDCYRRNRR
jgi:hypothetical protein